MAHVAQGNLSTRRAGCRARGCVGRRVLVAVGVLLPSVWGVLPFVPTCLRPSVPSAVAAPPADEADERFTVIKAGKIITNAGKDIRDGVIVIANGKIRNVGSGIEYPGNAEVIDAHDRVVMPGIILAQTRYGLSGYDRNGVHSNYNVSEEWTIDDEALRRMLDAGVTAAAFIPAGQGIPGLAAVYRTGGPAEQRLLVPSAYLRSSADKRVLLDSFAKAQAEIDKVDKAKKDFEEQQKKAAATQPAPASQPAPPPGSQPASAPSPVVAAQQVFSPPPIDPKMQGLVDLLQKKEGAWIWLELRSASEFVHLADVLKKHPVAYAYGGRNFVQSDLYRVVDKLGDAKARIALFPTVNRVPYSIERYPLVQQLADAGCEVSLLPQGDFPQEFERLRTRTAELVREGWAREAALKALTLNPAKLLGIEKRFGSIEKDKDADLIFLDADPLRPGSDVREVMIGGTIVRKVTK